MARTRTRNELLAAVIREIGWSQEQTAAHFRVVATESGAIELTSVTRSNISQWILGSQPQPKAASILRETLSRGLRRGLTLAEIGLEDAGQAEPDWSSDTTSTLLELGDIEMDIGRRTALATSAYSVAALGLPISAWWDTAAERAEQRRSRTNSTVTAADVDSVREMSAFFSQREQKRGGADGRTALVAYLRNEVAAHLNRHAISEPVRRGLYSAAGEMAYLCGWTAFDTREHHIAQHWFTLGVRLAAEADDPALAGHILRAMAHQAADLGHGHQAVNLATASIERKRYTSAGPRERALIGVVHARALAADGQRREALAALRRAEDDLSAADPDPGAEPSRVFFFGEASLASQTAHTLTALGDLKGAAEQFTRSVNTRRTKAFARTHSVTLGYLGSVQARQGHLDAAIGTWGSALDAMAGIHSGRAKETVIQMRRSLSPYRNRGNRAATDLDTRARTLLSSVA
ncbi:Tat pathway signal protein [Streptomyces sp. NPDC059816]|uniref:Tat pathway signal protein n=1 Tax=Streptomyces sp. NPDC059816 TaxID=3346960 RepID=UPI0036670301